jgi:hypothetical protein
VQASNHAQPPTADVASLVSGPSPQQPALMDAPSLTHLLVPPGAPPLA